MFNLIYIIFYYIILKRCIAEDYKPSNIPHTTIQQLKNIIESGNEETLVYFYTDFKDCPLCKEYISRFHTAVEYLNKLEDGKVLSYKVAVKFPEYGVNTFPQLVLFLGKTPFRYDNAGDEPYASDAVLDWVEEGKQTPFQQLTDETFEHLTQSSTGATTGDWLILFANGERADCMKPYIPDIANVALRMRGRKNAAYVDTSKSKEVYNRFKKHLKNECASILFFHRTELYVYNSDDYSSSALIDFILQGFIKQEALEVPKLTVDQHEEIDMAINKLQQALSEYAATHTTYFILVLILIVFLLWGFFFLFRKFQKRKIH